MERVRRTSTVALGSATALLGLAMIAATLVRGGGPGALGVLVGVAFTLIGCGRVYLATGQRLQRRP